MSQHPFVSVILPCLDAELRIESSLRALLAQDYPRERLEILVADAMSHDATREILDHLAKEDPRVRVVDNASRTPAAGLNAAIRAARGEVLVRVDVNAEYDPGFIRECVAILQRAGVDALAGAAKPVATRSLLGRALSAALRSPLALDVASLGGAAVPAAFHRRVFETVGLFDAAAEGGEARDLDLRLRAAGAHVEHVASLVGHYVPRWSFRGMAKQAFADGQAAARALAKHKHPATLRGAIPFAALVTEGVLLATAAWHSAGFWVLGGYAAATGAEALRVGRGAGISALPVIWALFPALHASHGAGFAVGLAKHVKAAWAPVERLSPAARAADVHVNGVAATA